MQERSRGVTAKDVGRTLAAFARVARARSLYQDNSAALTRMRADLYRGFQEILADRAVLSLRVRPEAFVFEDQVVLQDENPEQSIPFALYRDGVRRLDFSRAWRSRSWTPSCPAPPGAFTSAAWATTSSRTCGATSWSTSATWWWTPRWWTPPRWPRPRPARRPGPR